MGVWMPAGHHSFHSELLFAELQERRDGRVHREGRHAAGTLETVRLIGGIGWGW